MHNPKQLAQEAVLESLAGIEIKVTDEMKALIEDLISTEWESRNRHRMDGKDEVQIMKLVKDYIVRQNLPGGKL